MTKLVIGVPIERAELFTEQPLGSRCSNGHERADPTHHWCPRCGTSFRSTTRSVPTALCVRLVEYSKSRIEPTSWEDLEMSYWVHIFRTRDGSVLDVGVVGQPVYVDNALHSHRTMLPSFKPEELPVQVEAVRAELETLGLAVRGVRVYVLIP